MNETTDFQGNIWLGPLSKSQLRKKKWKEKKEIYVWAKDLPTCSFDTPHYLHRITLEEFNSKYPNIKTDIYVLKNSIPQKKEIAPAIKAAYIAGIFLLIATLIKTCTPSHSSSSEGDINVNGDSNFVVSGEKNTIFYNNNIWEWENLRGEAEGNFVNVRIAFNIITDQFRWAFGSHDMLDNGFLLKDELPQYLHALPNFNNALGLITVGMASQEGKPRTEIDRAKRRADNILLALNPNEIAFNKAIYRLNLGIHKKIEDLSEEETSYQRKVIVIGIMDASENITFDHLKKCLHNALQQSGGLSFDKSLYSNFDLRSYQTKYFELN